MDKQEFSGSCLSEIDALLEEQTKYDALKNLQLANDIAALVMNENAEKNYKTLLSEITGDDLEAEEQNYKLIIRKKIKTISNRLKLRCPYIDDDGNIIH